jgi:hypothetical protein
MHILPLSAAEIEARLSKLPEHVADLNYDADSEHPQSGKAVAEAIDALDETLQSELSKKYDKQLEGIPYEDLEKPVRDLLDLADSTAQSLDSYATKTFVQNEISALVDSAPDTLDTLKELSEALNNDDDFATTVTNQIASINTNTALATIKPGAGEQSLVIDQGIATSTNAIAGGTTDKSIVTNIVGYDVSTIPDDTITEKLGHRGLFIKERASSASEATGALSTAYGVGNQSITGMANTIGVANQAGSKGFYIHKVVSNQDNTLTIYLNDTQKPYYKYQTLQYIVYGDLIWKEGNAKQSWTVSDSKTAQLSSLSQDDFVSIILFDSYSFAGKVLATDATTGTITVSNDVKLTESSIDSNIAFEGSTSSVTAAAKLATLSPTDFTISFPTNPNVGAVDIKFGGTAVGLGNIASGNVSSAFGIANTAEGSAAFVTGRENTGAFASLVGGYKNEVIGSTGFAVGRENIITSQDASAVGQGNTVSGYVAHAEGLGNTASGGQAHAEGRNTEASGSWSHTEGRDTKATGEYSHAEGNTTTAGYQSHAEGKETDAQGTSHTEGFRTYASNISHAEGQDTEATGLNAHAEGQSSIASGAQSHAEGQLTEAIGARSHAEGLKTIALGANSHAEGGSSNKASEVIALDSTGADIVSAWQKTKFSLALTEHSHVEGFNTLATGWVSHAEGHSTLAQGGQSHAEGRDTKAKGNWSHTEGQGTIASAQHQHVQGKFNIEDTELDSAGNGKYAHIIGNGSSDTARSNAHTIDWNGNAWFAGDVTVGENSDILAKQKDLNELAADVHINYANAYKKVVTGDQVKLTDVSPVKHPIKCTVTASEDSLSGKWLFLGDNTNIFEQHPGEYYEVSGSIKLLHGNDIVDLAVIIFDNMQLTYFKSDDNDNMYSFVAGDILVFESVSSNMGTMASIIQACTVPLVDIACSTTSIDINCYIEHFAPEKDKDGCYRQAFTLEKPLVKGNKYFISADNLKSATGQGCLIYDKINGKPIGNLLENTSGKSVLEITSAYNVTEISIYSGKDFSDGCKKQATLDNFIIESNGVSEIHLAKNAPINDVESISPIMYIAPRDPSVNISAEYNVDIVKMLENVSKPASQVQIITWEDED